MKNFLRLLILMTITVNGFATEANFPTQNQSMIQRLQMKTPSGVWTCSNEFRERKIKEYINSCKADRMKLEKIEPLALKSKAKYDYKGKIYSGLIGVTVGFIVSSVVFLKVSK